MTKVGEQVLSIELGIIDSLFTPYRLILIIMLNANSSGKRHAGNS